MLTVGGAGWWGSRIGWEVEMNNDERRSSLGGHARRSVVGDDDSLDAFYRSVGGQQMGWERMCPTEMVNLQCISFRIEEKLRVEMVEGGG
jgi:hypothetical protein